MTVAPLARADSARPAAGHTCEDVLIDMKTSQDFSACSVASRADGGIASPNQTTPGRIGLPHSVQTGNSPDASTSPPRQSSAKQRSENRLPWNSTTEWLPARWWRPSTFCVTSVNCGTRSARRARALLRAVAISGWSATMPAIYSSAMSTTRPSRWCVVCTTCAPAMQAPSPLSSSTW